jgi:type IV secretory pathway VirB10-like protein
LITRAESLLTTVNCYSRLDPAQRQLRAVLALSRTASCSQGSNNTVVIGLGVADATGQAMAQTMNRFLNRMPTVTIREGHRVKVYLTSDIDLPATAVVR